MWLVRSALRRPVTILVAVFAIALCSILALQRMPVDMFPNLGAPAIYLAQPLLGDTHSLRDPALAANHEGAFGIAGHRRSGRHQRRVRALHRPVHRRRHPPRQLLPRIVHLKFHRHEARLHAQGMGHARICGKRLALERGHGKRDMLKSPSPLGAQMGADAIEVFGPLQPGDAVVKRASDEIREGTRLK